MLFRSGVCPREEGDKHRALTGAAECDRPALGEGLDRPEDPVFDGHARDRNTVARPPGEGRSKTPVALKRRDPQ